MWRTSFPPRFRGGCSSGLPSRRRWRPSRASLLLDEPFGALDPGTREQMHVFLKDLRAETKMTVFMVTHDLPEAFKLGDRVLVFDKVRWDPHDPAAYGATITYDFDARNGGIPFQLQDETPAAPAAAPDHPSSEGETA
jgi:NitT/TauT family transport system ATP-binding protein